MAPGDMDWVNRPERLDTRLRSHIIDPGVVGPMVHHPRLVTFTLADPAEESPAHTLTNMQFRALQERYEAAAQEGEWASAIFSYTARPYRADVFDDLAPAMGDMAYWKTLAELWIDQENPEDFTEEYRRRFTADRPYRYRLMTDRETAARSLLPPIVQVYRADISPTPGGLSWTTSRKTADFFARRFREDDPAPVYVGRISRRDIVAYWTRRGESEVLVLRPEAVTDVERIA